MKAHVTPDRHKQELARRASLPRCLHRRVQIVDEYQESTEKGEPLTRRETRDITLAELQAMTPAEAEALGDRLLVGEPCRGRIRPKKHAGRVVRGECARCGRTYELAKPEPEVEIKTTEAERRIA